MAAGTNVFYKLNSSTITIHARGNIPGNWMSAISNSALAWTNVSQSPLTFNHATLAAGAADKPFELRLTSFSKQGLGSAPGTVPSSQLQDTGAFPYRIIGAKAYLNADWTWNLSGNFDQANKVADVRTVATHEYGHVAGLEHPNVSHCTQPIDTGSVMYIDYQQSWILDGDDINGIRTIYP